MAKQLPLFAGKLLKTVRITRQLLSIDGGFILLCIPAILLVPAKWLFSWITAAVIHEFGHLVLLKICKVQVYSVRIGVFGAKIATEAIPPLIEAVCTISGPVFGLFTLLLRTQLPYLAVSGFFQSVYNLIPIFPLDGGRFLRCILLCFLSKRTVSIITALLSSAVITGFLVVGTYISEKYQLGILPMLFPSVPILISVWKNSLHYGRKNSTIRESMNERNSV